MQHVARAVARLNQTITDDQIDWRQWLKPSDKSHVVPAESLAETCKQRMLLGGDAETGLTLPWDKTSGKVLIRPGKVAVWSGWSFHGKSTMLKQVMLSALFQGEKVLIASMEEDMGDVWRDLAIMYAGGLEPSVKALDAFIGLVRGKLWFYDQQGVVDAKRMQAVLRYAGSELGITQGVVDSLMMLAVERDDYDAQSSFMSQLKAVGKDTGVTVHLVAHMRKRDGKGGDEQPGTTHDIAGGHEIASKADYVFNVWRDKLRKDITKPACILGIEKQRGRINWIGRVGLDYHEKSGQFVNDSRWAMSYQGG